MLMQHWHFCFGLGPGVCQPDSMYYDVHAQSWEFATLRNGLCAREVDGDLEATVHDLGDTPWERSTRQEELVDTPLSAST